MDNKFCFDDLRNTYDYSRYPEAFCAEYVLMECLAERNGVDTFLVQNHSGESFIAKCYDKSVWTVADHFISDIEHPGLPKQIASFENETMSVTIRDYIEGVPLDCYAKTNDLTEKQITAVCIQLCDILALLHHRDEPVIHRDVKPQNIIVRPDGRIVLIDFDIARVYHANNEVDTQVFGTLDYAPPEQYGFSQTDCRTDIYSLGVLLRYLLTGSVKPNQNIKVYRPLARIINKCTAFSPEERFSDVDQVKRALQQANPKAQGIRISAMTLCCLLAAALLTFGGVKIYQKITYTPFTADAIPVFLTEEERIADAVRYMRDKYHTDMFDTVDDTANVGMLKRAVNELYGLEREYVYAIPDCAPMESDAFFLPWGWEDGWTIPRDVMVYAAVKVHDPSIVADWSEIKDDNGYYPGVRAALLFADKIGVLTDKIRPDDINVGEMALLFADFDRIFDSVEK